MQMMFVMRVKDDDDDDYYDYGYDYSQFDGMQGRIISGMVADRHGEYYTRVSIGYPLIQQFYLTVDTGSAFTWLQCEPCDECYEQIGPIFDRSKSNNYHFLDCDEEKCAKAGNVGICDAETHRCMYATGYGDNSTSKGDIMVDALTFVNSNLTFYRFLFGCGYENKGLLGGSAGILGLGPGHSSLPSQIEV